MRGSLCIYTSQDESETPAMALKRENETLRRSILAMESLFLHLRNSSEDVAHDILKRLRSSADINSMLPEFNQNMPTSQLSEHTMTKAFLPPVYSRKELELMAQHPMAYPPLDPSHDAFLAIDPRLHLANGPQIVGDVPDLLVPESAALEMFNAGSACTSNIPEFRSIISQATRSQIGPQLPDGFFDMHLQQLNVAFWTLIPITNQYAAAVISLYLSTDHPILGLFDAELFVSALVAGTLDFCSPFLVSSLLAFASVSRNFFCHLYQLTSVASICF